MRGNLTQARVSSPRTGGASVGRYYTVSRYYQVVYEHRKKFHTSLGKRSLHAIEFTGYYCHVLKVAKCVVTFPGHCNLSCLYDVQSLFDQINFQVMYTLPSFHEIVNTVDARVCATVAYELNTKLSTITVV